MFIDLTIAADFSQIRQSEIGLVDLTNFSQTRQWEISLADLTMLASCSQIRQSETSLADLTIFDELSPFSLLHAFLDISRFGATGPPIVDKFFMLEIDCGFIVSNQKVLDRYF